MKYLRGMKYYFLNYIVSWLPFYGARYLLLKWVFGIKFHSEACIHLGVKFFGSGSDSYIGKNTVVNPEVRLDLRGGLLIGENVSISREVFILTLSHNYNEKNFPLVKGAVEIDDDAWIGIRAMIMPGVKVGKGAVIGSNSVVTKDVPPYAVVAGNPAKIISKRTRLTFDPVFYKPFMGAET